MRIRHKLLLGFLTSALLTGVTGYLGFSGSQEIAEVYDEIVDETAPALLALGEIKASANKLQAEAVSIALIQSEGQLAEVGEEFEELEEAREALEKWRVEFAKVAEDEDERKIVEQIREDGEALWSAALSLVDAKRDGKIGREILNLKEKLEEKEENLEKSITAAITAEEKELEQGDEYADEVANTTIIVIIAMGGLAAILAAIGGYFISQTIANPIARLQDAAIEIGKGDLNKRAQVESKDEVGVLAASFNQMANEIQRRNEELQTMNEELQSTNEDLQSSNEELRSTTEELETSNEELLSTSEELQASNEELRVANEELNNTQEKLVQQEKLAAIGQLASGVGHELRNPLGVIKNAAYYIKTKVGDDNPKMAKHLAIMEREINSSNRIISDLLGFSRTRLPSIAPVDVGQMVTNAMEVVEMPPNILLVKELDSSLPKVMVDADQIHQVFVNLGLNAIQAMAEGGQLTVKARLAGDHVEVDVTDTGCGIPQENLKKLFDPFFSTKARGVGLGLAVTHGIVERNKGAIEVTSTVGEGTTFLVKLPAEKHVSEKKTADKQEVAVS